MRVRAGKRLDKSRGDEVLSRVVRVCAVQEGGG